MNLHDMAVALGRRGGLKGGVARARALSPERRSQIARTAVLARWHGGEKLPPLLYDLFWEYDVSSLRLVRDRDTLNLKVITRGSSVQRAWLRDHYGEAEVRRWIVRRAGRGLTSRQMRQWRVSEKQIQSFLRGNPALQLWENR